MQTAHPHRPYEELRPRDIIRLRDASGCALVPVSPSCEWHAYHLPLGTDALISERLCAAVAARIPAVWLRALPLGVDQWRSASERRAWGLDPALEVFGMNFPALPLSSETVADDTLRACVAARLALLRHNGFRHIILIAHHNGGNQRAVLSALAHEYSTPHCHVHAWHTGIFAHGVDMDGTGGHAGYSETHWALAFCPELVDVHELPEGCLNVAELGILHHEPVIPAQYNPRHCDPAIAQRLRDHVLARCEEAIRTAMQNSGQLDE